MQHWALFRCAAGAEDLELFVDREMTKSEGKWPKRDPAAAAVARGETSLC